MMAETMTQTFNLLNINSKRMHKKQNNVYSDISSTYSSKDSIHFATTNNNDWHRVLLARLKPGVTGKYRTTRRNDHKSDTYLSRSLEDSNVILQSYTDDSQVIDNRQVTINPKDSSEEFNSFLSHSMTKDSHYVKNFVPHRLGDHITSLKRRVRKQQLKHFQDQVTIVQETNFRSPSLTNLFVMSYSEQPISSRRYKQKKSSCVVSLPRLTNSTRMMSN